MTPRLLKRRRYKGSINGRVCGALASTIELQLSTQFYYRIISIHSPQTKAKREITFSREKEYYSYIFTGKA